MKDQAPILIKRYSNRKLYDTYASCYITLEKVHQIVKGGRSIKVIDNQTKLDITSLTLTQSIFNAKKTANIPVKFLEEIIRQGNGSFFDYLQVKFNTKSTHLNEDTIPQSVSNPNQAPLLN